MIQLTICEDCPFCKNSRCKLRNEYIKDKGMQTCHYLKYTGWKFTPKQTLMILHEFQKWRRGGKGKMINPAIIGYAIDEAMRYIRNNKL